MRKRIYLTQVNAPRSAEETYEEFSEPYDYPDQEDSIGTETEQAVPSGAFSSPARTITLVFSVLLLLVVGATGCIDLC